MFNLQPGLLRRPLNDQISHPATCKNLVQSRKFSEMPTDAVKATPIACSPRLRSLRNCLPAKEMRETSNEPTHSRAQG